MANLEEKTEAVMTALVVYEEEEYFLIEATSPAAIAKLKRDEARIIARLMALREQIALEYTVAEFSEVEEGEVTSGKNPFGDRPSTNTWHPETSNRQTDEFHKLDTAQLRERLRQQSNKVTDS